MSLAYTHYLIPNSPKYCPESVDVANFTRGIVSNGNVSDGATITFSQVTKGPPRVRRICNPMTGETIELQSPSRTIEHPKLLSTAQEIVTHAAEHQEYDAILTSQGVPCLPPLAVGYIDNDRWKPMDTEYHLEIRCRIRCNVVRLYMLDSEEEIHQPPDIANYHPRFDEDCSAEERDALFVHPEIGAFAIQDAACGMFWIEFNYGKFLFPRLRDNGVNILDDSVVDLAKTTFNIEFVQACNWG